MDDFFIIAFFVVGFAILAVGSWVVFRP